MIKYFLRFVLLALLPLLSFAQTSVPQTFVITADTAAEIKIERKYLRIWDDSIGTTEFKKVSNPTISNRFKEFDTTRTFDFSIKTFWYKLKLKNSLNKKVEIGLPANAMENDIYFCDSTLQWQHLKTGGGYHKSTRDGYQLLNVATLTLDANQEIDIFIKQHNELRFQPSENLMLFFMDAALQKKYTVKQKLSPTSDFEKIINAFLMGMILITCMINLSFYRAIKEKEYLYFSLFLIFLGLNNLVGIFPDLIFGFFNSKILFLNYFTISLWFFFLMRFIQYFFKTKEYLPKWNKFLTFYNYLLLLVWAILFSLEIIIISTFWFDRLGDSVAGLLFIFMDALFITILLTLFNKKVKVNIRILATLPLMFLFGPLYSVQYIYQLADKYFKVKIPAFVQWVNEWGSLLTLIGILWVILFFSWLLFKRYKSIQEKLLQEVIDRESMEKEKEAEKNLLISQQNEQLEIQVAQRTKELQTSIEDLKATQSQLIQSEKMASLGELTAGIAHEIQNPLNFVNNFSEVNAELILEMKEELVKGNIEEATNIAKDIADNEQKIIFHGKRADGIVKGMLQHSRSSTAIKEPTDINKLADEYLRLAYHGLRAKDKSFNATMKTYFDETLQKVNIIPQDMGRVILNLITNAFYVVDEKKKSGIENYEPTVTVSTKKIDGKLEIKVADNGSGIPQKVIDKIFQPFFTTKPSGKGTGLGLSLSYDIVKAHDGELKVNSIVNEKTEFVIILPI